MNHFSEGYYAGLTNDRDNPNSIFSTAWLPWHLGNQAGLTVHCATVEAVYLSNMED